ncbi:nucleotide sugar dehydrogenase [Jeotgalibacillus campisalis]|uniref:UDP-N-acetyl-D-galactosamine dehydrogenase n=1 Tax=Jeotgalibacillus campisalis TaxID=220754 RepID=A0A0C2VSU4_9BACL|nr:nucleotide sugar dehydrogenase [Jeotgalibacillus campisalis]KIL47048.1 UDP-N-acetyl-D-galactosamine dehydrogenase [Jeotgalibacillus campisalis]
MPHSTNRKNQESKKASHEKRRVAVVGLGYVGLPVAVGFSRKYEVIGYDVNVSRINALKQGHDATGELSSAELKSAAIHFTADAEKLGTCHLIIVAVPTPITSTNEPDLTHLKEVSRTLGKIMADGVIIVYESTVYPGATEEVCIPLLEEVSGRTAGKDFFVGYSPERINPGDQEHTFTSINKVVAAQDEKTLETIHAYYQSVIDADVYKASSLKVAEAAKIIENTQRDINIALMNEIAMIFRELEIDTFEALEAASTKWNFLPFYPGLVGGHCIGVDPYYLIYKAKAAGYQPHFLCAAREVNDYMPEYIVKSLLEQVVMQKMNTKDLTVTLLGITFKQNIPDIRNSKALEIAELLQNLGIRVQVCDPHVSVGQFKDGFEIDLRKLEELDKANAVILAVPHELFTELPETYFTDLLKDQKGIIMDIKGALTQPKVGKDVKLWKL